MFDKTLDTQSTVVSLGAFDGKRDVEIIKNAQNKDNILKTITVETNETYHEKVIDNLSKAGFSVEAFPGKIEEFNFKEQPRQVLKLTL